MAHSHSHPDAFMRGPLRSRVEDEIERLISLLDAIDGDADLEAEDGIDEDENLALTLNPAWQRPSKRVRKAT
jgi:hypothetical protein